LVLGPLRATVRDVDPNVPIAGLQALSRVADDAITPQPFTVTLMGVFAAMAFVLVAAGMTAGLVLALVSGRLMSGLKKIMN
jgi:hypothetical protein